jgi:hypothetical protein
MYEVFRMPTLTREAVLKIIGLPDEALVAEVAATGATEEELASANAWTVNNEG